MTDVLPMPDGILISQAGYHHAEQVVTGWMVRAESDVDYLALIVSLSAHVQSDGQSQPSQSDRVLIKEAGLPWPLNIEFKVAVRNCLRLNEMHTGFSWIRPDGLVSQK